MPGTCDIPAEGALRANSAQLRRSSAQLRCNTQAVRNLADYLGLPQSDTDDGTDVDDEPDEDEYVASDHDGADDDYFDPASPAAGCPTHTPVVKGIYSPCAFRIDGADDEETSSDEDADGGGGPPSPPPPPAPPTDGTTGSARLRTTPRDSDVTFSFSCDLCDA